MYKSVGFIGYETVEAIGFCTRSTIIQSLHCTYEVQGSNVPIATIISHGLHLVTDT